MHNPANPPSPRPQPASDGTARGYEQQYDIYHRHTTPKNQSGLERECLFQGGWFWGGLEGFVTILIWQVRDFVAVY